MIDSASDVERALGSDRRSAAAGRSQQARRLWQTPRSGLASSATSERAMSSARERPRRPSGFTAVESTAGLSPSRGGRSTVEASAKSTHSAAATLRARTAHGRRPAPCPTGLGPPGAQRRECRPRSDRSPLSVGPAAPLAACVGPAAAPQARADRSESRRGLLVDAGGVSRVVALARLQPARSCAVRRARRRADTTGDSGQRLRCQRGRAEILRARRSLLVRLPSSHASDLRCNFGGRDATRGLAKQSFDDDMLAPIDGPIDPVDDLTPSELDNLRGASRGLRPALTAQTGKRASRQSTSVSVAWWTRSGAIYAL